MSVVPWIPSPKVVIEYLRHALGVSSRDVVLDLGCGDGRVLLEFAKSGAIAICIEINKTLCNVTEVIFAIHGLKDRLKIICNDFFKVRLSEIMPKPTIVYAYLYPSILEALAEKLEAELDFCTIIASLDFPIRSWSPIYVKHLIDENDHNRIVWIYVNGISNPKARLLKGNVIDINKCIQACIEKCKRELYLY
jgi:16S rRNA A1518/A1519 N6-dimethyltransferase RsmA/KsgA/DIM1 with predicted DNA glycosylase/AP lyase activity